MYPDPGTYRYVVINYYFYPGGNVGSNCGKVAYQVSTHLSLEGAADRVSLNLCHEHGIYNNQKITGAYQGPVVCKLSRQARDMDRLRLQVKIMDGFKRLNLRALLVLVP